MCPVSASFESEPALRSTGINQMSLRKEDLGPCCWRRQWPRTQVAVLAEASPVRWAPRPAPARWRMTLPQKLISENPSSASLEVALRFCLWLPSWVWARRFCGVP